MASPRADPPRELPQLGRSEVDDEGGNDDPPFPSETEQLEGVVGDDGDVEDREDDEGTDPGGPEEDLVVEEVDLEESSLEVLAL